LEGQQFIHHAKTLHQGMKSVKLFLKNSNFFPLINFLLPKVVVN
jgi:hypothetical protein